MAEDTATIEAPVEDLDRDALLESARKVDQQNYREETGESSAQEPEPRASGEEPAKPVATTDDGTKVTPVDSETETAEAKEARLRDEKGRFLPKDAVKPEEKQAEPEKPESAYTKAQKEADRRERSWQALEAEKARVRAQEQTIAQREAEINRRAQAQAPQRATKDGFTAPDYRQAASDFTANGDHENAFKAIQAAEEIERFEWQHYQENQAKQSSQSFQANMEKEIAADPDLGNGGSAISQEVQSILKEHPYIAHIPDGFSKAVEIARLRLEAGSASELRKQLQETKAELDRLTKVTQPARGGPTSPSAPRKFEDLPQDEQRAQLIRQAEEADQMQPV